MKNIIEIDGEEYIKHSKYKELKEEKMNVQTFSVKDYLILDPANVCAIYPLVKKEDEIGEELEIENIGTFRKVKDPEIKLDYDNLEDGEVINIDGSRYSKKYIDGMKKIGKVWFQEQPVIYEVWDKDKEKFLKDNPILFVFGERLCLLLAPRVEDGF